MRRRLQRAPWIAGVGVSVSVLAFGVVVVACSSFGNGSRSGSSTSEGGSAVDGGLEDGGGSSTLPSGDSGPIQLDAGDIPECGAPITSVTLEQFSVDDAAVGWEFPASFSPSIQGSLQIIEGKLKASLIADPTANTFAFLRYPWSGVASFVRVKYELRLKGTFQTAQIGCKIIFGTLATANVSTSINIESLTPSLEIEAEPSGIARVTKSKPLSFTSTTTSPTPAYVTSDLFVSGPNQYTARTAVNFNGMGGVTEDSIAWQGAAPTNGDVRCGIMESHGTTFMSVEVDNVSLVVCP